ncbi:MAG TPA: cytochrome b [Woeseiaceae bacterium]|nr:cytochrome b [Woeseiaceae bacterium]
MAIKNTELEYGSLAKVLHWLVAAGIVALLYLGIEQSGMERGDAKNYVRFVHGSIATVVLALMTIRIAWRLMGSTPAHPATMPAWQAMVSSLVHWGLYIVVFVQLTAGAMVVAAGGKALPVFGLFSIPLPVAANHNAHEWWEGVHKFMWKPLAALIVLHILGALYNHFVVKNDVLRRMTVGVK